ncbi:hypothetical protein SAMN05878282_103429 [Aquipseudomonas alcaligenes]|uniref:Uncharacterized protein n=1 Tax=Aquipseudomonas alcaligenes TaxID=43263 RepID=A0A1N6S9Q9_AQUAC|nr:hypothetical protein SAMN05878282_103429 [Pseudomonas alcaligenes]
MSKPVIIVAPQGAGKTLHAEKLRLGFCCSRIVDSWNGIDPLLAGDIALTHAPIQSRAGCRVYSLDEALAHLKLVA